MSKFTKVLDKLLLVSVLVFLVSLYLGKPLFNKYTIVLFLGFLISGIGVLGLLKKSVLLTRTKPVQYEEGSIASIIGKAFNFTLVIIGIMVFVIGMLIFVKTIR